MKAKIDQAKNSHRNLSIKSKKGVGMPSQSSTVVQAQLETTTPGDAYEQEADRMADMVMRKIDSVNQSDAMPSSHCPTPTISCFGGTSMPISSEMESQLQAMQGGGHVMPEGLRAQMEGSFGHDFSNVRLHTDSAAADMSSSINAKAFTHGNDIYFNQGQFQPNTPAGQHLIAHELTHTVQQGGKVARYDGSGYYENLFDPNDKDTPASVKNVKEQYEKGKKYISRAIITFNKANFALHSVDKNKGIVFFLSGHMSLVLRQGENDELVEYLKGIPVSGGGDIYLKYGKSFKYFTNNLEDLDTENKSKKGTVTNIKGWAFNSGAYTESDVKLIGKRYTDVKAMSKLSESHEEIYKKNNSRQYGNMDYAVFFNGGEALHPGALDSPSHGCVHVGNPKNEIDNEDDDLSMIKFINKYSVPQKTQVSITYIITKTEAINIMKELESLVKKIKKECPTFLDLENILIDLQLRKCKTVNDVKNVYENYKKDENKSQYRIEIY